MEATKYRILETTFGDGRIVYYTQALWGSGVWHTTGFQGVSYNIETARAHIKKVRERGYASQIKSERVVE